ncbi:MAG TPA: DUF1990 family protein [Pseudonocardiaceae bacterium]|nr:DUF1990 family protein [Pseudonocardiaceae bacterium]
MSVHFSLGATAGETVHFRWLRILARWSVGVALVSWRYLWATTPLHRSVEPGDATDFPPVIPDRLLDDRSQPLAAGVGPLFHRLFAVTIANPSVTAATLIANVTADLNKGMPSEVAEVERVSGTPGTLTVGDEIVVRMPGPWDGPVRVVHRSATAVRLATLNGHLEAGQIEFRARPAECSTLRFEIEAWARPGSRLVHLLYTHLRLAKEIQLNMWVRFCRSAANLAGGRARGGVTIRTRVVDQTTITTSGGSEDWALD